MKREILDLKLLLTLVFFIVSTLFLGANFTWSKNSREGEIETLEVIEIPGTVVNLEDPQFLFPEPDLDKFQPFSHPEALRISADFSINHNLNTPAVALDPIGKERGIKSKPQPIKIGRPPYPRIAKEQGWQGTVKLTLTIGPDGKVSSAKIHTSSGFPILDTIALDATHEWLFQPQMDGEFPLATTVNVPVMFNLHEKK